MDKYKVKAGSHVHSDGKKYTTGDVIEDDRDLVSLFPGKFARVNNSGQEVEADDDDGKAETTPAGGEQPAKVPKDGEEDGGRLSARTVKGSGAKAGAKKSGGGKWK